MPDRIVAVLAADNNYSRPLAATVHSIVSHLSDGRELALYICDIGITEQNRIAIESVANHPAVSVHWVPLSAEVLDPPPAAFPHISRAAYARLFIPKVVPEGTDRVLYLDCDLIVRRCIGDLFDTPMGDSIAMAVQDSGSPFVSSLYGVPYWSRAGRRADELNFNTGVLLMNVRQWDEENVAGLAVAYVGSDRYRFLADQEAINAVLGGRIGELDPRWNQQTTHHDANVQTILPYDEASLQTLLTDPWIVHYSTGSKAWTYGATHPYRDEWFAALDQTPYRGWRPSRGRHVRAKLRRAARRLRAELRPAGR